jgi:glycosyltransferase involved in cell wall biosynthesis
MKGMAPEVTGGIGSPQDHHASRRRAYRVLMIAPTSFFADYGCHVRILEEARVLQSLGSQVTICTYANGRNIPNLDVRRTMNIPWRRGYEVGSSRHKIAFDALLSLRAWAAMWQVKPQIIHAHLHEGALIGYFLAKLWRVPLVFDFQGSMTGEMLDHRFLSVHSRYYAPLRRLEHWIDHVAPRILTSSVHAAEVLSSEFSCSRDKIVCLPDGVNTDMFKPIPRDEDWRRYKESLGIPPERLVIVYLGKLAEYQGTDHLLQAARLVCRQRDDVHFLVAGYPYVDHYIKQTRELGIADHVTCPGRVPYEDAPRLLSLGDVAVSPKLSLTEGAGKLLNYMAMALPVVAYDTAVSHEYLGGVGMYAARGDSSDLAQRLLALCADPKLRYDLGMSLRTCARERFSWETIGELILDVYASLT